jgi:hypothetical protein
VTPTPYSLYNGRMVAKRRKKANTIAASGERTIDLEFELPNDMRLQYADNINVLHTPTEFTVSFLQSQPPLVVKDVEIDKITKVRSVCVARLVISPPKWAMMLRALTENYKQYVERYIQPELKDGNDDSKTPNNTSSS